jgi:hypothetical protein
MARTFAGFSGSHAPAASEAFLSCRLSPAFRGAVERRDRVLESSPPERSPAPAVGESSVALSPGANGAQRGICQLCTGGEMTAKVT